MTSRDLAQQPTLPRVFAGVGAAFGTVFVLVNAGGLTGPWPWTARAVGVLLLALAVWFGVVRNQGSLPPARAGGVRTYWLSVLGVVVGIPAGALVLNQVLDRPELTVLWVVLVVGLHFLPAGRFGLVHWFRLGLVLVALAVAGAVVALTAGTGVAPLVAVLAGLGLLVFSATSGRSLR